MENRYQYRPARFFLMTGAATWIPWLVGAYLASEKGKEAYGSLVSLVGLLAPLAVGLVLILTSGSRALQGDLKSRIVDLRRIRPVVLVVALAMPPVVMAVSIGLSLGFGQSRDQFRLFGDTSPLPAIMTTMVLAPIIEELGWRGYGVDSLRARMGMLKASLLFGGLWSLWHAPLTLLPGTYHYQLARMENPLFLANFFVSVVPAAIIANWFYYRNNRSIVAAVLLHSMLNAAAVFPTATQVTKVIATLVYLAIAAVLVLVDRRAFGAGPRNFVPAEPR